MVVVSYDCQASPFNHTPTNGKLVIECIPTNNTDKAYIYKSFYKNKYKHEKVSHYLEKVIFTHSLKVLF